MLDRFQRITMEEIRASRGMIRVGTDDGFTTLTAPDDRLRRDLALAVQGYYNRINNNQKDKEYGSH